MNNDASCVHGTTLFHHRLTLAVRKAHCKRIPCGLILRPSAADGRAIGSCRRFSESVYLSFRKCDSVGVLLPLLPAYILFKTLPTDATVEGPWKGLRIKLGGGY